METDPLKSPKPIRRTLRDDTLSRFGQELWLGFFNTIGVCMTLWVLKRLCSLVGAQAYGTSLGNLKIAGILFLGVIVSGSLVTLGEFLFISRSLEKVEAEDRNGKFFPVLLVMLLSFVGFSIFLVRVPLMLVGVISQGGSPPAYLEWMFRFLDWFNA